MTKAVIFKDMNVETIAMEDVVFEDMPKSVINNEFVEETVISLDLIQRYPFALEQLEILKKDYLAQ